MKGERHPMNKKRDGACVNVLACVYELWPVSTRDNRVYKGPLGRSLHSLARNIHSTVLLFALVPTLTGSLTSLTPL